MNKTANNEVIKIEKKTDKKSRVNYTEDWCGLLLDCIFYPLQLIQPSGLSNEQEISLAAFT